MRTKLFSELLIDGLPLFLTLLSLIRNVGAWYINRDER